MGSFLFAPTLLFLACNYHGTAGNRRTHSSPCSEGLQSLQPRTGVLAVEGPESSAWRTEARQGNYISIRIEASILGHVLLDILPFIQYVS